MKEDVATKAEDGHRLFVVKDISQKSSKKKAKSQVKTPGGLPKKKEDDEDEDKQLVEDEGVGSDELIEL